MTNEELNTELYKKLFAEQENFKGWLLSQPPTEILNHAYEYVMKEDILLDELAKTLCGENQKHEFVILDTEFGEKSFRLCDIKGIYLIDNQGCKTEITDFIKSMLNKER